MTSDNTTNLVAKFLFHNSHDKFDRKIIVSNKINQIESQRKRRSCVWVQKEFVITEALTHGSGHGTAYLCSEPSVIPLRYSGTPNFRLRSHINC